MRCLDAGGHDIDRKHLAAEKIFEGVDDENDRGDLKNPERQQRDRVGDKKLDERGHDERQATRRNKSPGWAGSVR